MIIENWMSLTSNCYGDAYMNVILCQGMESLGEAFITASGSKALIYYYTGKPIYQRYFFPNIRGGRSLRRENCEMESENMYERYR